MVPVIKLAGGVLINGARQNITFSTPVNNLSIGNSVYMNINGVRTEFLIIHKGNPKVGMYDSSCDGIWLLMKDAYEQRAFYISQGYPQDKDYGAKNSFKEDSQIVQYLNNTIYNKFDSNIKSIIKQVKIPSRKYGSDSDGTSSVYSGANGVSAKIFLLSFTELGYGRYNNSVEGEGVTLSYFSDCGEINSSHPKRVANMNGSPVYWWTRTPCFGSSAANGSTMLVSYTGSTSYESPYLNVNSNDGIPYCIRPVIIIPNDTKCDFNMNIIV